MLNMFPSSNDSSCVSAPNPTGNLILEDVDVFAPPKLLPLSHPTNHEIVIHLGVGQVRVRPYKYTHFQKEEMDRLVLTMLEEGIIRPSPLPYSSPIIFIRKKRILAFLCRL